MIKSKHQEKVLTQNTLKQPFAPALESVTRLASLASNKHLILDKGSQTTATVMLLALKPSKK
jgi:hypothetical protein